MSTEQQLSAGADVYTIVTNDIISRMEGGSIPWHASFRDAGVPKNLISGLPYSGLNTWLLASLGYPENLFLTWKQVRTLEASVKRGEKGHLAVYWQAGNKEPSLRYYKLFNIAQCENIPEDRLLPVDKVDDPIGLCKQIVEGMPKPPGILEAGATFSYNPQSDMVSVPHNEFFEEQESYYSWLFYHLVRSTGHTTRLNRPECMTMPPIGEYKYLQEDLIAEMGSSYLCSFAGIPPVHLKRISPDTAFWLERFYANNRFVITASMEAQKAVNYILNLKNGGTGQTTLEMPEVM